jgi:glycosyltransferase involved in cell wall biosynthesis
MACGCPVIASTAGAIPEVAGEAALLVDPRSVREIAAAIARVASESALRASLARKGMARARAYTWEASAAAHLQFFEHILDKERCAPSLASPS